MASRSSPESVLSVLVCVQLPEPQLGLALPSMARGELPPWPVELCVVDAPVIETTDVVSHKGGGGGGCCEHSVQPAHARVLQWHLSAHGLA